MSLSHSVATLNFIIIPLKSPKLLQERSVVQVASTILELYFWGGDRRKSPEPKTKMEQRLLELLAS